jgi:hypothetical protein
MRKPRLLNTHTSRGEPVSPKPIVRKTLSFTVNMRNNDSQWRRLPLHEVHVLSMHHSSGLACRPHMRWLHLLYMQQPQHGRQGGIRHWRLRWPGRQSALPRLSHSSWLFRRGQPLLCSLDRNPLRPCIWRGVCGLPFGLSSLRSQSPTNKAAYFGVYDCQLELRRGGGGGSGRGRRDHLVGDQSLVVPAAKESWS